ncbi:hydroxyisourate hydrolase [Moritella sp. 24]|uniref:hydroxyisourate hydrolase n=1 Tax=Moritella sp. 24 TaxID=2746230 RepID=UPI001BA584D4|nr:hydroxyisourate hydrolase [Moritella sp. 24]QUM75868.1 hydroxyisourate hydrolase [Moritella sp. 24]
MSGLSTHVLDTANGVPGAGITIKLYRVEADQLHLLVSTVTNSDGRTDALLLTSDELRIGQYQLQFDTADYFRSRGAPVPETAFLDDIVIRFGINNTEEHYHVPLLVSPFSYSTYRGS